MEVSCMKRGNQYKFTQEGRRSEAQPPTKLMFYRMSLSGDGNNMRQVNANLCEKISHLQRNHVGSLCHVTADLTQIAG